MVAAIRGRIAATSNGLWTLHAPVDPGITVLELYVWLLEQRLFWLDQIPEPMVRAALGLLGELPQQATIAGTVLVVEPEAGPDLLPSRRVFRLDSATESLLFTTGRDIRLWPDTAIHVATGGVDRTADLAAGRIVELFAGATDFVIGIEGPRPRAGHAALLVELDVAGAIAPEWSPRGHRVRPPAVVVWDYEGLPGTWLPFARAALRDGTVALRRSGVVRFEIPAHWTTSPSAAGTWRIRARVSRSTFTAPPRLRRIAINAVVARHQTLRHRTFPVDWPKLPGQVVDLATPEPGSILAQLPALEHTLRLRLRERDGRRWRWMLRADLTGAGPSDRVFTFDRSRSVIEFGNGLTGRLPVPDRDVPDAVRVTYRVGGGRGGNVGVDRTWESVDADGFGAPRWRAINAVPAEGGDEAESVQEARARASSLLRRADRAVVPDDYVTLALGTPGVAVARAHAAPGTHPCFPCQIVPGAITVFVVADAPRPELPPDQQDDEDDDGLSFVAAPVADPGALAEVADRLETRRLLTAEVLVRVPRYRAVRLEIDAAVEEADQATLERTMARRLRAWMDPLGGRRGNAQSSWRFGAPVRPSAVRQRAQTVLGNDGEILAVRVGLDGEIPTEPCRDIPIGPNDLVYLEALSLHLLPGPRAGGLR
jgi:predicted phage baseplate assembly protein